MRTPLMLGQSVAVDTSSADGHWNVGTTAASPCPATPVFAPPSVPAGMLYVVARGLCSMYGRMRASHVQVLSPPKALSPPQLYAIVFAFDGILPLASW